MSAAGRKTASHLRGRAGALTGSVQRRPLRSTGFILPFILFLAGALMLGAAVLASLSTAGLFGSFSQLRTREAREAAETGAEVILNTLNASPNRKLLVAPVAINGWNDSQNLARLRNPCSTATNPATAALALGGNSEQSIGGDSRRVFVLKSLTLRNPGRSASFVSSSDSSGPGGTSGLSSGGYNDGAIVLDPEATTPQGGFIELVVEGRIYDAAGQLKSSARVRREFVVLPKCCGIGFAGPYGNDNRLCSLPSLVLGLNGGGVIYSGTPTPTPTIRLTAGLLDSSTSANQPSSIFCLTAASSCASAQSGAQSSLNGVPLRSLALTSPPVPSYPTCSGSICTSGHAINTTSLTGADYIRVNTSGQVEACNAANNNSTAANAREPALPTSVSNCSTTINNFCIREVDATGQVFHCRIAELTVLDDTGSGANGSLSARRQNNTLWIDSTRGSIYLYLNQAWIRNWAFTGLPVNLFTTSGNQFRDGQVQHLSCLDSSGVIQTTYTGVCNRTAAPRDIPRVMLYSDTTINVAVGDDGFLRDLLVYLPRGTVTLSHPSTAACDPPTPSLRLMLWVNNLAFSRGASCGNASYVNANAMSLVVPPGGSLFSTSETRQPILYEWVARGSTFTSLF